jgi:GT2 family glycosyltransferase
MNGTTPISRPPQPAADPPVFIILVNWNGRAVTLECLDSLARVDYAPFTVVVVDNGSSDGSADAIRAAHPEVRLLPLTENRRFAGGNNEGIRYALNEGAELLLLLNNDTTVAPDFLRVLVDRMRSTDRCGLVSPKIYYANPPDCLWYAGGTISYWTGTMRHTGIRETDRGQYDTPRDIGYATGCCILTSADVIRTAGMLDESYFIYTEDADWSVRINKAGYRLVFEPRAHVWHKLSVTAGGHLSSFKLWNKFKSNFRFFARHASWYHWFTFPWLSHIVNLYAGLRYWITRHPR